MNITIYYLSKKIVIEQTNQIAENQSFKNLDKIKKKEIYQHFIDFISDVEVNLLTFVTSNLEIGFNTFRKSFKLIYAAGGLIEKDNSYLFIYRLKKWDLPKGKLEMGESPEEAGIRECEEECGITQLTITKTLEPTYHMYPHKGKFAVKKTFWYAMQTKHTTPLIPQKEEGIEHVEWFNNDDIKNKIVSNSYPAILDVIKNIS